MKAWNVHLMDENRIGAQWLILAGEDLTHDALMDDIADTGTVNGLFYRLMHTYTNERGTRRGVLVPDRVRIVPMHMVAHIEETNYIGELQK